MLKTNPKAKIESPAYIVDKTTGEKREFDVLITYDEGHRTLLTAIECRDRKNPVGSLEVEGFVTKCRDASINLGVIVSSKGFAEPALKKAQQHGIHCLTLTEAEKFEWLNIKEITYRTRQLINVRFGIPSDLGPLDQIRFCDKNGRPQSGNQLTHYTMALLQHHSTGQEEPGQHQIRIHTQSTEIGMYVLPDNGRALPMDRILIVMTYIVGVEKLPVMLHHYKDAIKGTYITNVASTSVQTGDKRMRLLIVEQPDGSKTVNLVPE